MNGKHLSIGNKAINQGDKAVLQAVKLRAKTIKWRGGRQWADVGATSYKQNI